MIIRDPLYDYLHLTNIEESIIDHPLFQRLRFISQNGTAYLTYPSNRSCRFLHSLGAMEISGRICETVFGNQLDEIVRKYLIDFFTEIKTICASSLMVTVQGCARGIEENDLSIFSGLRCEITPLKLYYHDTTRYRVLQEEAELSFSKIVVIQSVRLAALLHDIGHLPFSHTLETALSPSNPTLAINDKYLRKLEGTPGDKPLHERIGISLLDTLLPADSLQDFNKLCRYVAKLILSTKNKPSSNLEQLVSTLHTVISGDLDADRLDYCIRDPRLSGMELGAFDLERITSNMMIVYCEDQYHILPNYHAVSAVEEFFHQRYLMYKYLIYHHNKSRMDCLVKEIVKRLAEIYCAAEPRIIKDFLIDRHFDYLWEHCNDDKYFLCDENHLLAMLADLEILIQGIEEPEGPVIILKKMIDTFLKRKTHNLYSLFKRREMYIEFVEKVSNILQYKTEDTAKYISSLQADCDAVLRLISDEYGVILMYAPIKPKTIFNAEENIELRIAENNKKAKEIGIYSPYLESLLMCVKNDQMFHIFIYKDGIKSNVDLIGKVQDALVKAFADMIKANENLTSLKKVME